jgi:hypothetical protein
MEFVVKDADGQSKKVDVWEFAVPVGVDLTAWAGASSGLLDDSDVDEISAAMQPGSVAVVVIYENRWGSRPRGPLATRRRAADRRRRFVRGRHRRRP